MKKPSNYDQISVNPDGFQALPAGNYVCTIMEVLETQSSGGNDMLKISLDIAEGDFKGYYTDLYKNNTNEHKKWGCVKYLVTGGQYGDRNLKAFVTAVENSNSGFKASWTDKFGAAFKGKIVGCSCGREEYIGNDGAAHWSTKPQYFRTAAKVRSGELEILADKELSDDDKERLEAKASAPDPITDPDGFMNIPDNLQEELPF